MLKILSVNISMFSWSQLPSNKFIPSYLRLIPTPIFLKLQPPSTFQKNLKNPPNLSPTKN